MPEKRIVTCAELAKRPNSREFITVHTTGKSGEPSLVTLTPKGQAEIVDAMRRAAEEKTR